MAQERKVIKSVEDATCANCIYSHQTQPKMFCARTYHVNVGYDCQPDDYCGEGIWLLYSGRVEGMNTKSCASTLEEVYEWFTE